MKSYDALIRVSRMGDRKQSAESTMTLDDQSSVISQTIKEAGDGGARRSRRSTSPASRSTRTASMSRSSIACDKGSRTASLSRTATA